MNVNPEVCRGSEALAEAETLHHQDAAPHWPGHSQTEAGLGDLAGAGRQDCAQLRGDHCGLHLPPLPVSEAPAQSARLAHLVGPAGEGASLADLQRVGPGESEGGGAADTDRTGVVVAVAVTDQSGRAHQPGPGPGGTTQSVHGASSQSLALQGPVSLQLGLLTAGSCNTTELSGIERGIAH